MQTIAELIKSSIAISQEVTMSFEAVSWAWKQKALKPFEKLILVALADRHNPDHGCFPSIGKIIEDTGISRSSVLRTISQLQAKGLIKKESAYRDNKSQTSNRYIFPFEGVSERNPTHVSLTPLSVSQRHPNEPVRDKPLKEDNIRCAYLFEEIWDKYPRKIGKGAAKKAWVKACTKKYDVDLQGKIFSYISSIQGKDKKFVPHLATWLNQERWEDEIEVETSNKTSSDYLNDLFDGDRAALDQLRIK